MPAIITAAGTLGGALGGITLSNWTAARREERQAQRQREDASAAARHQAYAELLGASAQFRAHVEIVCGRHWKDLNVRLSAAEQCAVDIGLKAAGAALLSSGQLADAAVALRDAASTLYTWVVTHAQLGEYSGPGDQFVPGQVLGHPDFTEVDRCIAEFLRLAAAALGVDMAAAGIATAQEGKPAA